MSDGVREPGKPEFSPYEGAAAIEPQPEVGLEPRTSSPAEDLALAAGGADWAPDAPLVAHRTAWREVWSRFLKDKFAVAGLVIIIVIVLVAIFAPWIAPHDPATQYDDGLTMKGMPVDSSGKFLLGTDPLGRDLLSRIIYGARVSLVIGVLANGFALVLGVIFGLVAGYMRGKTETLLMRATDVMMAFPIYLFAIALSAAIAKPSIWVLVLVIGIVYWTPMTRVIHGEVLSIREKEFVDAAQLTGCTNRRIPATAMVALFGIFFELLIGIPVGMISALRQYSIRDRTFTVLSLLGIAAPAFWLGMIFLYIFAFQMQLFPLGGYEGWAAPQYAILPGLVLGVGGAAWYSRMLRSSMLDILNADYVKAARAKGLPERTVVWRHIMRNAWSPIVTLLGMDFGWFLGGVLIIEIVFGIPGIGEQTWYAIEVQDLPLIMGTVLFAALLVTVSNFVVDIAYTWLDPRVNYS